MYLSNRNPDILLSIDRGYLQEWLIFEQISKLQSLVPLAITNLLLTTASIIEGVACLMTWDLEHL